MLSGTAFPLPMFYHDHLAHYGVHTDELKSPANRELDPMVRSKIEAHTILHMRFINPVAAFNLAMELGFMELIKSPENPNGLISPPPPTPPVIPGQPQGGGVQPVRPM